MSAPGGVGVTVRAAVVEDAGAIARVHVDAWRAAYAGLLPEATLAALDVDERAARRREQLARPEAERDTWRCWVAMVDGAVVGFANVGEARDPDAVGEGEVYAIYVDPARWAAGVGRALMTAALGDLRGRGACRVVLWALRDNARAEAFYHAAGFVPDDRARESTFGATGAMKRRWVRELAR